MLIRLHNFAIEQYGLQQSEHFESQDDWKCATTVLKSLWINATGLRANREYESHRQDLDSCSITVALTISLRDR